jgi:hypothetical protein
VGQRVSNKMDSLTAEGFVTLSAFSCGECSGQQINVTVPLGVTAAPSGRVKLAPELAPSTGGQGVTERDATTKPAGQIRRNWRYGLLDGMREDGGKRISSSMILMLVCVVQ